MSLVGGINCWIILTFPLYIYSMSIAYFSHSGVATTSTSCRTSRSSWSWWPRGSLSLPRRWWWWAVIHLEISKRIISASDTSDQLTQQLWIWNKFNPRLFPSLALPFFVITPYPLSLLTPLNFGFKWVYSTYYFDRLRDNFSNFQFSISKIVYLYKISEYTWLPYVP